MNQNNQNDHAQEERTLESKKSGKTKLFLKTATYTVGAVSAIALAAPIGIAGYAYLRTTQFALDATKWAFDHPIKTIVGSAAAAGMYYGANNIDWNGIEEKVTQNTTAVTQNYQEQKITKLEKTLDELQVYTGSVEQQNELLKQGGSVIYEQYDPLLLMGIGGGSAVLGGLVGGLAGYAKRKKENLPRKNTGLTQV